MKVQKIIEWMFNNDAGSFQSSSFDWINGICISKGLIACSFSHPLTFLNSPTLQITHNSPTIFLSFPVILAAMQTQNQSKSQHWSDNINRKHEASILSHDAYKHPSIHCMVLANEDKYRDEDKIAANKEEKWHISEDGLFEGSVSLYQKCYTRYCETIHVE